MRITKKFPKFELDYEIENYNEFKLNVIYGPSGSGKSVSLNEIYHHPELKKYKKVFFEPNSFLIYPLKVKELLGLNKDLEYNEELFHKLKIHEILNTKVNKLSKGEQRRLCLFLTISTNADVYFFDEPLSFLDIELKKIVKELLENLAINKIVFVSLHENIFENHFLAYHLNKGKLEKKLNKKEKI